MPKVDAPVTFVIAGVTALVSLAVLAADMLPAAALNAGFIPLRASGAEGLPGMLPVWITPFSAALLHGGLAHLLLNLVTLLFCGRMVEQALGGIGVGVLYLAGAYMAAIGQWASGPGSAVPMLGASGAISAVIGAYALMFSQRQVAAIGPIPAVVVRIAWLAAAWVVVQLLTGVAFAGALQVAIYAHIGGFLAGLLLARPLLVWRFRKA